MPIPLSYTMAMTALVTPMREAKLDLEAFEKLLDSQIQAGIRNVLVLGSTGEALLLEEEEKIELVDRACRRPELHVWLGCLEVSSERAKKWIEFASRWPLKGLVLLCPYYIKPSQNDLIAHFLALMNASPWPCIIYNNPSRCAVAIEEATLIELASHPRFFGIKECQTSPDRIQRLAHRLGSHQWLLCGEDSELPATLIAGAQGIISVASNAAPELTLQLLHHFENSSLDRFRTDCGAWLEICSALKPLGNPRGIKALLFLMEKMSCEMRAPLIGATSDQLQQLRELFQRHRELFANLGIPTPC